MCLSVFESNVTFWVSAVSPAAITMLETPSSLVNASRTCFLQPFHVTPDMVTVYTVLGAAWAMLIPAKRASAARAFTSAFMVFGWIAVWLDRHRQRNNDTHSGALANERVGARTVRESPPVRNEGNFPMRHCLMWHIGGMARGAMVGGSGRWIAVVAAMAVLLLAAAGAWVLRSVDPERPGAAYLACRFHEMTGLQCPGCGMTRATHHLLNGRVERAFYFNAFYVAALPLTAVWGVWWVRHWWSEQPLTVRARKVNAWLGLCFLLAWLGFGVFRNLPGWPML